MYDSLKLSYASSIFIFTVFQYPGWSIIQPLLYSQPCGPASSQPAQLSALEGVYCQKTKVPTWYFIHFSKFYTQANEAPGKHLRAGTEDIGETKCL